MDRLGLWAVACLVLVGCASEPKKSKADRYKITDDSAVGVETAEEGDTEDDAVLGNGGAVGPDGTKRNDTEEDPASETDGVGGSLAASSASKYGGSGFCDYEVTLRDIAVEIALGAAGDIASATVKDLVVETTTNCPHPAMSPAPQSFTLRSSSKTADGFKLEFTGDAKNPLKASLVAELVETEEGFDATLTWARTDQTGPLGWTVTAEVPLN